MSRPDDPEPLHLDPPASALAAHLLGGGPRRGLKGGPQALDTAKSSYLGTEWSGEADRRAPPGGRTRKRV